MFLLFSIIEVLLCLIIIMLFSSSVSCQTNSDEGTVITYNFETRQVILDGKFVVASFRECSLNRSLFEYLYQNPGRRISFEELDLKFFKGREVNLTKIGDAMGFKCDLRKLLFTCDGGSITFHPNVLASYNGPLKVL